MKKLPVDLDMNGLGSTSRKKSDAIDINSLAEIKGYIVAELTERTTINHNHSSYGLKHYCENYLGKYVSNGQFIAAMILRGFKYERDGINAYFNIKTLK